MTNTNTATVETLTAEVRVLQVGNRQITMSVFNQLDTVPWHDMTPCGRVRPRDADARNIDLVGRHWSGELVRSRVAHPRHQLDDRLVAEYLDETSGPNAAAAPLVHDDLWYDWWSAMWPANLDGRPLDWERASEIWDELNALPLIVLAGLR